jgi:hypothetical protein
MIQMIQVIACPTCARAFQETQGDAAGFAIVFMLFIIVPIASAIILFLVRIALRQGKADTGEFADPFLKNSIY